MKYLFLAFVSLCIFVAQAQAGQLCITIPDADEATFIDAISVANGYAANITQVDGSVVPNPMTKKQFVRQKIKEMIVESAKTGAAQVAIDAARQNAVDSIDAIAGGVQ